MSTSKQTIYAAMSPELEAQTDALIKVLCGLVMTTDAPPIVLLASLLGTARALIECLPQLAPAAASALSDMAAFCDGLTALSHPEFTAASTTTHH
jgi:hypothetical protein